MTRKEQREQNKKKLHKNIIITILVIIAILALVYIIYQIYNNKKDEKQYEELAETMDIVSEENINEKLQKLQELNNMNNEIVAWIDIPETKISYPVLHADNNDFYLTHDYNKQYSESGSLFLDKDVDMSKPSSNFLIYGHRNKNGLMFEELINYKDKEFYENHKNINFTTLNEDTTYEIMAVFYSRVYYKRETNVFRYYYFIDANSKEEYDEYVKNSKEASIYDTGVDAEYGDQLLTLSTCEYSQDNGRFVVVAKKVY